VLHLNLVEACVVIYFAVILIELLVRKQLLRFGLQAVALAVVVVLALLLNNSVTGRVAFGGGDKPIQALIVMFVATLLGIAARYVFYLQKGAFSWLDLLKPTAITPIVMIPLIGTVLTSGDLNTIQVASFAFLAFQNGFFWQIVLAGAKPATQTHSGAGRGNKVG
jgi:hypothetical protein